MDARQCNFGKGGNAEKDGDAVLPREVVGLAQLIAMGNHMLCISLRILRRFLLHCCFLTLKYIRVSSCPSCNMLLAVMCKDL